MHNNFWLRATAAALLSAAMLTPAYCADDVTTEPQWSLNQQNADLREFIAQVAKITGETYVIDPRVKSGNTVTVLSSTKLSKKEVYDVFLEVLGANGYSLIPKSDGHIFNIVPNTQAKSSGATKDERPADGVFTTKVIELHSVLAVEVIPIIRPLIAQHGHAAASASGNAVIVSDVADNVERITALIKELDEAGNNDYEVIQLHHAWVGDVAKIIAETLTTSKTPNAAGLHVIADERSNRLVVKGNASKRARVRKLATTLDEAGIRKSTTKVMFLSYADAQNIAEILAEASRMIQTNQPPSSNTTSPASTAPRTTGTTPTTKSGAASSTAQSGNAFVRADTTQNALVMIAPPETLQAMEQIVHQLDVPRAQVLLEAVIVEVSGGINDALGVQWGINGTDTNISTTGQPSSVTGNILSNSSIALGSIALRADNFGVLVSAISSDSNNNILSTPSMLTLDNEEAELIIGKNIPIQTGSYQTSASGGSGNPFTTTERKDVGLKLKITPHINEGESLRLMLEQEVSSLDINTNNQLATSANGDLLFNTRSLKTAVLVEDGQTVVIGGLIEDTKSAGRKKVPLLGDIPLIGRLFQYRTKGDEKKNLMLFIRPTIMRNSEVLVRATEDRFSKLKLITSDKKSDTITLPDSPHQLFDVETYDLRNGG